MKEAWEARAACVGSSIDFVSTPTDLRSELLAKHVCSTCPVRSDCLDDALRRNHAGIRGGRTEAERQWMKQRPRRRTA